MSGSLRGLDPETKKYLRANRVPDVYEALLTGLVVMCPADPKKFILDNLRYIRQNGFGVIEWDMFVEPHMRPNYRPNTETILDLIFNFDENAQPTPEMYERAYSHYNTTLKLLCFNAWMQYHLRKKRQREEHERKMEKALIHYKHRMMRIHLHVWIQWVKFRKGRQAMAFNKIQHVYHVSIGRVIFVAWHNTTLDAKKTREYFERLERGENMDDDDLFGKGSGEARDDISLLPRKVAVKIFSYVDIADLARCACVCRSWKVITQANSLWSTLDLSRVRNRITDKVAKRLLNKCRPYLVHLNVRCCPNLTKTTFVSISECRNIQDLNLSECPGLTDETLKIVAEGCTIVLYLNLSHTQITDAALRTIAKNCINIQYLSLAFCKKFTDRGLYYLSTGKGCKKLLYLDLSACMQITPEGFKKAAEGCSNIHSLMLNEFNTLNDSCVLAMTEHCHKLKYVSFLGSPYLTDESFKALGNHKKLQTIKIDANQKITDASFKHIGKLCSDLKHLYLVDCQRITDMTLKSLISCRNLTVINLADCVRITDTGVRYIVDAPCGPKLQEFNLTNCIRVGDIAIVNIHKRCHNLSYLSLCFCEHISEAGIELLGQTHSLTSLDLSGCNCGDQGLSALGNNPRFREVTLSECLNITDLGLQKFAQQCPDIERLDLSHCQQLTDGAIKNLAFCCRMLNVLNLSGCKLLTDLSVQYLSGVCHYLIEVDLTACILISDKALKYLRKGCKNLTCLYILYCKNITKHSAQKLMKHVDTVHYNNDDVPSYFGY
ncbi:unnamed protein product [Owenia fusiformis]|uniref:F-box domain-containing protein n=1 Tax=Owenia fusiformis TaxID=6347 RepID=A0A8S4NN47_OWEFU|nr:unnamed protein product [Owenia fusiformis]